MAAVWLQLGAQALDFTSGVLAAGIRREIDSRVGWSGLLRKVLEWCQVGVAALVQRYLESFGARVASWLVAPVREFIGPRGVRGYSYLEGQEDGQLHVGAARFPADQPQFRAREAGPIT